MSEVILETDLQSILTAEIAEATPFRLLTLFIFIAAITHTLLANHFTSLAKKVETRHNHKEKTKRKVSFLAEVLYFFGEIEVIFGLWVIPLMLTVTVFFGWGEVVKYLNSRIYVEPLFIVVIMSLASTRPIVRLAEKGVHAIAGLFGGSKKAWWLTILTLGPILGCVITEVAALTIAALLFERKLYMHNPTKRLAYGTLALMFVNFSVTGMLSNFSAPPALLLSRCWDWELGDFFRQFSVPVILGLVVVNIIYFFVLRKDFSKLKMKSATEMKKIEVDFHKGKIPIWIYLSHLIFLAWVIATEPYPPIFLGGYLLFLGFHKATIHHQYKLNLKRPLLVGLFLAGLVIHGGFQGWWIQPLIGNLGYGAMMVAGTVLTAFNENATVAYLSCLLIDVGPKLRYALASGLVIGGGLTIIAHAPNPVGQALLRKYFGKGISPWYLFLAALLPTLIFFTIFYLYGGVLHHYF